MTTETEIRPAEVDPDTRPQHHHVIEPAPSRMTLCGLIPPWEDQIVCSGMWNGERNCPDCGAPYCATCLRKAGR